MKEHRETRISARITPSLYKKVLKEVKARRWSVSDVVEEALIYFIEENSEVGSKKIKASDLFY